MTRFIYIYDTYCGWCYGAAPVITALLGSGADVSVMHRHLFQGTNTHRMGDGFGRMALQYDNRIAQLTRQSFSEAYLRNVLGSPDEVLDSTLTAQAAALIHDHGAKLEMALAHTLQNARYIDGVSASDEGAVRAALSGFGVTGPLRSGNAKARQISTAASSLLARHGLKGVPVLLQETADRFEQINLTNYYDDPHQIAALAA